MPIANCFINKNTLHIEKLEQMASEWAEMIGVSIEDVCISVTSNYHQAGRKYTALVNLYVPSLWPASGVQNIQICLLNILKKYLKVSSEEIFILTLIVQPGNVVENGEIIGW